MAGSTHVGYCLEDMHMCAQALPLRTILPNVHARATVAAKRDEGP